MAKTKAVSTSSTVSERYSHALITKSQELPGIKQSAHEYHAKIVAVLRKRDPDKARKTMRAHLQTCEKAFSLLGKISDGSGNGR